MSFRGSQTGSDSRVVDFDVGILSHLRASCAEQARVSVELNLCISRNRMGVFPNQPVAGPDLMVLQDSRMGLQL